jgi:hypothetical protein
MQKVYLLRLMPVCMGLLMLAAYFCNSCYSQVVYNCSLIKADWFDACSALRVVGAILVVFSGVGVTFAQSPSQWEARANT